MSRERDPDDEYDRWRDDVAFGLQRADIRTLAERPDVAPTPDVERTRTPAHPVERPSTSVTSPRMQALRAAAGLRLFDEARRR
jgi:hypothetical protein